MEELALTILDLAQNSLAAGATCLTITVEEDGAADRLTLTVTDNGRGMDPEFVRRVLDPFTTTRTTRRGGLGLALLAMTARQCEGDVSVASRKGAGTTVTATFRLRHWDRPPLGDLPATLVTILAGAPHLDLTYRHTVDGNTFTFSAHTVREELQDVPLNEPKVLVFLREYLEEALRNLHGGGEDDAQES
ncbi:MAG TPA: ATP-binding protein [Firmicutes bacterium]|nr:ATP-binding protein [Bacillota bacterium]